MSLIVYKSSAGSGKTTTLVTEYLKLCFKNPEGFKHILAITFTNKAAREMKERILDTLKAIANRSWKKDARIDQLFSTTGLSEDDFEKTAQKLLSLIIHRFDDFSVSTIDAFVHKIIRTFANEVNLPPAFEVVLKNEDFVPEIIKTLYDKVGKDAVITEILTRFVLDQAENEKNPDPTNMLDSFITNQFGEDHFLEIKKLAHLTTTELWNSINELFKTYHYLQHEITTQATQVLDLLSSEGIEASDMAGGKNGLFNFFKKASEIKTRKAEDLPPTATVTKNIAADTWVSGKADKHVQASILGLKNTLLDHYIQINNLLNLYYRAYLYTRKIYILALAHEIRQLLTAYTNDTSKVHISEFNKLVYNQVADQPVPYIYERLGKKYRHFLIDEFQDTSVLQWNNLLPLIDESLSYGRFNMLVGDAKQAIYRFRNGEVELFANLPYLYKNDGTALAMQRENQIVNAYEEVNLDKNWRSFTEIINFNNRFFHYYKTELGSYFENIYKNHEQIIPENGKKGGFVEIDTVTGENSEAVAENKLIKVKEIVVQLLDKKFKPGDIALLCRAGKDVRAYAAFLTQEGFSVLSEESLLVANAPEVQAISAFFNLIENPNNDIALIALADNVRKFRFTEIVNQQFYKKLLTTKREITAITAFFTEARFPLSVELMPLTEIADFVLRNILQVTEANVFVQYYFDFLFQSPQSVSELNQLWEKKKGSLFISSPENNEAIQVMTIHKSKGLAFEIVIVDADKTTSFISKKDFWIENETTENNGLPVLLLPITKSLALINKAEVYEHENTRTDLDYMNLLYVAFTRPVQGLFVITEQKEDKPSYLKKHFSGFLRSEYPERNGQLQVRFGSFPEPRAGKTDESTPVMLEQWYSHPWQSHLSLAQPEDAFLPVSGSRSEKAYGILVHQLLAEINQREDIDRVISKNKMIGNLTESEAEHLTGLFNKMITNPLLSIYFQPGLWCRNETEIINQEGEIIRLDRVVHYENNYMIIDYKTGEAHPSHHTQMEKYKHAIAGMQPGKSEALLVYLNDEISVVRV